MLSVKFALWVFVAFVKTSLVVLFSKGMLVTHMVLADNLVPAGTALGDPGPRVLVTPGYQTSTVTFTQCSHLICHEVLPFGLKTLSSVIKSI